MGSHGAEAGEARYDGIGAAASADLIRAWNIDVAPNGAGAPPGSGNVSNGEAVYFEKCAHCHGDFGEGVGNMPKLISGSGTLLDDRPIRTVGNYWPFATTLFDYIKRTMPMQAPQSLADEDVYSVTSYVLYINNIVPKDFILNQTSITGIEMPNVDGFYMDNRKTKESYADSCMHDCPPYQVLGVAK
ncbi:cytochrome c [Thalassospiraceae bacterium LMO-JJ14]|nr:cytochrome c [Thalassospiraceae bacterium LMO-JJ14]